jgi:hypothetical protein
MKKSIQVAKCLVVVVTLLITTLATPLSTVPKVEASGVAGWIRSVVETLVNTIATIQLNGFIGATDVGSNIRYVANCGPNAIIQDFVLGFGPTPATETGAGTNHMELGFDVVDPFQEFEGDFVITSATAGLQTCTVDLMDSDFFAHEVETITFNEEPPIIVPATLNLVKMVDNTMGGAATPGSFTMSYAGPVGIPSHAGSAGGTLTSDLAAGQSFTISETSVPNYIATFSGSCPNGAITLAAGLNTCTITNKFYPSATITFNKVVINDEDPPNTGTKSPANFNIHLKQNGVDVIAAFAGGPGIVKGPFSPGIYTASEDPDSGYTATFTDDCNESGTISLLGVNKICTITNNDRSPGGSFVCSDGTPVHNSAMCITDTSAENTDMPITTHSASGDNYMKVKAVDATLIPGDKQSELDSLMTVAVGHSIVIPEAKIEIEKFDFPAFTGTTVGTTTGEITDLKLLVASSTPNPNGTTDVTMSGSGDFTLVFPSGSTTTNANGTITIDMNGVVTPGQNGYQTFTVNVGGSNATLVFNGSLGATGPFQMGINWDTITFGTPTFCPFIYNFPLTPFNPSVSAPVTGQDALSGATTIPGFNVGVNLAPSPFINFESSYLNEINPPDQNSTFPGNF